MVESRSNPSELADAIGLARKCLRGMNERDTGGSWEKAAEPCLTGRGVLTVSVYGKGKCLRGDGCGGIAESKGRRTRNQSKKEEGM